MAENYLTVARSYPGSSANFLETVAQNPRGWGNEPPPRGVAPVWEREPRNYLGEIRNIPERPVDRFQQSQAEALSPTMGGYGMGQLGAETYMRAREGDYAGAAETGLPLLAIFAGPGAKTANRSMLARAQDMAKSGASRDAIWNETGWFQGADQKWRFEIDDSGARPGRWSTGRLSSVMKHKPLYEAYPDVGSIPTKKLKGRSRLSMSAGYQEPGKGLFGSWRQPEKIETSPFIDVLDPEGRTTRLLHEVQHGVQNREDFARGAELAEYSYLVDGFNDRRHPRYDHARRAVHVYADELMRRDGLSSVEPVPNVNTMTHAEFLQAINERPLWKRKREAYEQRAYDELNSAAYERSAGEVEARNVETRQHMTADQRRATPPWKTQDQPFERQIIQKRGELSPLPVARGKQIAGQQGPVFISDGSGGLILVKRGY